MLDGLPADQRKAILANVRSNEPDVAGVVGKVAQGAVDAGFVYLTDVEAAGGKLKAIDLPADLKPQVAYGVAVVKGAKHPQQAQAFVDGLLNGAGRDALDRAGFLPAWGVTWFAGLLWAALTATLVFLVLPVVAIFVDVGPR